nr:GntR family transcriptional regulator [uncultured Halomonas sp.]
MNNQQAHGLKRQTMANLLAGELRERILSHEFEEGCALRQDMLATEFGVSRIPVREALMQLEGEGLVIQTAHKGYAVSSLSVDQIREVFDLRALLEVDLLRRAIPLLTPGHIAVAKDVMSTFEDRLAHQSEEANWGAFNWQFHAALYASAGREQTMRILQNLHRSADRYLRIQFRIVKKSNDHAREDHRRLVMLCERRDSAEATRLLGEHILQARDELLDFITTRRTRG